MRTKKEKVGALALGAEYVFMDNLTPEGVKEYLTENEENHCVFNIYMNEDGKASIDKAVHFMSCHANENIFAVSLSSDGFNVEFSDQATAEVDIIENIWIEVYSTGEIIAYVETETDKYGIIVPYEDLVEDMDREDDA